MDKYLLAKNLNGAVKILGNYNSKEKAFAVMVKDFFAEINNNVEGEIFKVNNK